MTIYEPTGHQPYCTGPAAHQGDCLDPALIAEAAAANRAARYTWVVERASGFIAGWFTGPPPAGFVAECNANVPDDPASARELDWAAWDTFATEVTAGQYSLPAGGQTDDKDLADLAWDRFTAIALDVDGTEER
jgi:hypothetical protein